MSAGAFDAVALPPPGQSCEHVVSRQWVPLRAGAVSLPVRYFSRKNRQPTAIRPGVGA